MRGPREGPETHPPRPGPGGREELKARAGVPFLANWTGGLARWTRERTGLLPIYVAAEGYWGARAAGGS